MSKLLARFATHAMLAFGAAALGCGSSHGASGAVNAPSQGPAGGSAADERVYRVFVSKDAAAIAHMGQRIEQERPPLSAQLVERMFAFLTSAGDSGPPLQMLRPMLFRSVAVVVGAPAKPTLHRCATGSDQFRDICEETLAEVSGTAKAHARPKP